MPENELVKTENAVSSPDKLIELALSKGADLDKLEKILALKERYDAGEAKKAYNKAMSEFKKTPPKIMKKSTVDFSTSKGRTSYNYANLADVTNAINEALSANGLSSTFTTKQNGAISVTCKITHEMGHSEETTLSANADSTGNKNSIQAIGSTVSYLQRYTLLAATGLATQEQDDDGKAVTETITQEQAQEIDRLVKDARMDAERLLIHMKVGSYNEILSSEYGKATSSIAEMKRYLQNKQGEK